MIALTDGHHRAAAVQVPGVLRHAPVTLALLTTLWVVGLATGSVVAGPEPGLRTVVGVGPGPLASGHWWTLLTSALWCSNLVSYLAATVLLLVAVAPAEARFGARRTVPALVAAHVLGSALGSGAVALGAAVGSGWAARLAAATTVGPTIGIVGAALAVSWRLGPLWRRRVRLVLLVVLAMAALYSGTLQDVLRLAGGLVGLGVGLVAVRGRRRRASPGPAETRRSVAMVVAASALGPLLATVSGTAIGPLALLRAFVVPEPPDPAVVQAVCVDPTVVDDCVALLQRQHLGGLGSAVMALLPVTLLLVLATGLLRGHRFAWWGAVGLNLLLAGLGTYVEIAEAMPAERLATFGDSGSGAAGSAQLLATVAQPLAVVALLVVTRHRFALGAPRPVHRRWWARVAVASVALIALYVGGGLVLRGQFSPTADLPALLADAPRRFLPPGYIDGAALVPVGAAATLLVEWIGVLFWAAVIGSALRVLRCTHVPTGDAQLARQLLEQHGGSSMAYLATWRGNCYWFDPGGRAALAYRVIGRIALTTGEPFGEPEARGPAIAGFARFCAEQAWVPCLYGVGAATKARAEELGWNAVQVAEETVLPLDGLAFTGRKWQDVRTALNHARRDGVTAEWISFGGAPRCVVDQVRAISAEWVAEKGLPEMGFTLGGLEELDDERVRCLIAVDTDRTVHAVTSWLPVHDGGTVVGWTLDLMRRRESGFRPAMEFLIASAALQFQAEGAAFVSLSGAPLARRDRGERPDVLQRMLDRVARALEPMYGFGSLLAFKTKFQPEYRPLYLAYPDHAALPSIAAAVGRAYLPDLTAGDTVDLLRRMRRQVRRTAETGDRVAVG